MANEKLRLWFEVIKTLVCSDLNRKKTLKSMVFTHFCCFTVVLRQPEHFLTGSSSFPVPRSPDSDGGRKVAMDTTYTRGERRPDGGCQRCRPVLTSVFVLPVTVEPVDSWRTDANVYESGEIFPVGFTLPGI